MKNKISRFPALSLAVVAMLVTLNAQLSTTLAQGVFPIVTNNGDTGFGLATDGTDYLVGVQGDYVGPNNYSITAQLFGPTGATIGSRINPVPGHTGGNPRIACSRTNYLMVWPDDYLNGSQSSISAQLVSSFGGLLGSWFTVTTNCAQANPAVAYGGGKYLVVWNDYSNGTNWALIGQLFSANGTAAGGKLAISTPGDGRDEKDATIAFDGTNFLVVWQHLVLGAGFLTCGVFVSPSGTAGSPFAIAQTASAAWNLVGEVFNGTNYLVVYNAGGGGTNGYKPLYGRFVTPAGTFPGNEFLVITNGNPRIPVLAFDGADYLLCWNTNMGNSDFVVTNTDVRFQFLNAAGQPIGYQFTPFSARGSQVPLVALVLFDGKQFVSTCTLSAGGFTPPAYGAGVYGTFIPSSTAPPQLTAITYTNQQFTLSCAGTPGLNYAIQMATNLIAPNWLALTTNSPTNGPLLFTDTSATNRNRFYRALKQ